MHIWRRSGFDRPVLFHSVCAEISMAPTALKLFRGHGECGLRQTGVAALSPMETGCGMWLGAASPPNERHRGRGCCTIRSAKVGACASHIGRFSAKSHHAAAHAGREDETAPRHTISRTRKKILAVWHAIWRTASAPTVAPNPAPARRSAGRPARRRAVRSLHIFRRELGPEAS